MERGVGDGSGLVRDAALRIVLLEQLAHPVVGAVVDRRELCERERLADPTAQAVEDKIDAA
jgi:hypothetical protein